MGEINVPESLLNSELRLGVIEKTLEFILRNNYSLTKPSQSDIEDLKKKLFPNYRRNTQTLELLIPNKFNSFFRCRKN